MRTLLLALLLAAPAAWACSLVGLPVEAQPLTDAGIPPLADAGVDAQAPGQVVVQGVEVTLFTGTPCDGSGASCPQLDMLRVTLAASDDRTPADGLRYVAAFGATEAEAAAAPAELLFTHDLTATNTVSAYLGLNRRRSGAGFQRQTLCFTLAAVDGAGNVGARSSARCLDTTTTEGATLQPGVACSLPGCSTSAWSPLALLAALALRRARRGDPRV
ncbi:MAG: hypothetical protein ACOZQL_21525 [Myxococcota bacterium]